MGIVIRQSLKGTFVNYIGVVLGIFVQFYIVTKYLDPTVIGLSKVIYEVSFLLSTFALLGSTSTSMRFFPYFKDEKTGNHGFLYYYLLFPTVGVALLTSLYVLLKGPISGLFSEKSPLFNEHYYYVLPMMIVLTFWTVFENYANINMRIAIPKAVREIGMRLFMLLIYLAYGFGYVDVTGLVIGFIVCYGICMTISGSYALHVGGCTLKHDWSFITPELKSRVGRYAGFLILAALGGNIMGQLDLFMLSSVKGLYSAGIYTIVVYMAEIVNMPSRNITPISTPIAAEAMKENNREKAQSLYQEVSVHQTLASCVLLLFIWINLDNIFAILPNGEKYEEGRWAVLFLGLSRVVYGMLNFGNTLISFSKYYYWTLFFTVFLTAFTILTNLAFIGGYEPLGIPAMGLTGAAVATLLASFVSYSYQQYIVQVKIRTNPFTWAHFRILCVVVLLWGVSCLIPSLLEASPWLDILCRTSVVGIVAVPLIYYARISPQVNWFLDKYLWRRHVDQKN